MVRAMLCLVPLMLLATVAVAQEVTMDVEDVPLSQAMKLLSDLSGVSVAGSRKALEEEQPRVTLKFGSTPLKEVIQELCEQAGWHVRRGGVSQYYLCPGVRRDDCPRYRIGDCEVILTSVRAHRSKPLDLRSRAPRREAHERLDFDLVVEGRTDDAMVPVYRFGQEATAITDTGAVLTLKAGSGNREPPRGAHEPLDGRCRLLHGLPPSDARSLALLEGELLFYADVERAEAEFTADEVGVTKQSGRMKITYAGVEQESEERPAWAVFELLLPDGPMTRDRSGVTWWWTPSIQPHARVVAERADGSRKRSWGLARWTEPRERLARFRYTFPAGRSEDPPTVKMTYTAIVARNPTKRAPFKFENIPLPRWEADE